MKKHDSIQLSINAIAMSVLGFVLTSLGRNNVKVFSNIGPVANISNEVFVIFGWIMIFGGIIVGFAGWFYD